MLQDRGWPNAPPAATTVQPTHRPTPGSPPPATRQTYRAPPTRRTDLQSRRHGSVPGAPTWLASTSPGPPRQPGITGSTDRWSRTSGSRRHQQHRHHLRPHRGRRRHAPLRVSAINTNGAGTDVDSATTGPGDGAPTQRRPRGRIDPTGRPQHRRLRSPSRSHGTSGWTVDTNADTHRARRRRHPPLPRSTPTAPDRLQRHHGSAARGLTATAGPPRSTSPGPPRPAPAAPPSPATRSRSTSDTKPPPTPTPGSPPPTPATTASLRHQHQRRRHRLQRRQRHHRHQLPGAPTGLTATARDHPRPLLSTVPGHH